MIGICCKVETQSLKKKKKKEMPLCKVPNDGEGQNKGEMSCFYFNPISLPPQPEKAVKEQTHHLL